MARYTGPKDKISRRFGIPLFGPTKALEHKNYPPGMHGPKGGRRKVSEYGIALAEKQKLRFQYGVLERQFRRYFEIASTRRGVTGEILLQLLETRLDNVVFRLGLANSRSAARQLVGHGHVTVNGRKVDISSYAVRSGDTIAVRDNPKSRSLATWNLDLIVERGYALACFYSGDLDPDTADFSDGIEPAFYKPGQTAPTPSDAGAISTWAWGYHRVVDFLLEKHAASVDGKRIAAVGHSRNGKTTLLAAALDDRIALAIPHQAGCGGTAPDRVAIDRKDVETIRRINTEDSVSSLFVE